MKQSAWFGLAAMCFGVTACAEDDTAQQAATLNADDAETSPTSKAPAGTSETKERDAEAEDADDAPPEPADSGLSRMEPSLATFDAGVDASDAGASPGAPDASPEQPEPVVDTCIRVADPVEGVSDDWYDIQVEASGFDEYEDALVRVVSVLANDAQYGSVRVKDGGFTLVLPKAASRSEYVSVYVDQDENDACTDGEPAWSVHATKLVVNEEQHSLKLNIQLPVADCNDMSCYGELQPHPIGEYGFEEPYCTLPTSYELTRPLSCVPKQAGQTPDIPGYDDFTLMLETAAEYNGKTLWFRVDLGPELGVQERSVLIADAGFEFVWEQGFDRNRYALSAQAYVDLQGDGACSDGDPVWSFMINNTPLRVPIVHNLSLDPENIVSPPLNGSSCAAYAAE